MSATLTTWAEFLKEGYDSSRLRDLLTQKSKGWAKLETREDFYEDGFKVTWKYGTNAAVSSTIAHAQAMVGSQLGKRILIDRMRMFGVSRIDRELIRASSNLTKGALMKAVDAELKGTEDWFLQNMARALYAGKSGSIGRINSATTGATITLADANCTRYFTPGMQCEVSADDGGGTVRGSPTYVTVLSTNPIAGTVTATGNWNAISGCVSGDYIFPRGMYDAHLLGFADYCPATVTSASFLGVDRTVNPFLLAGYRETASASTLVEAVGDFLQNAQNLGVDYPTIVMHSIPGKRLMDELGSRIVREEKDTQTVGTKRILFTSIGRDGVTELIIDPHCQTDTAWGVDWDYLYFKSLGPAPHYQEDEYTQGIAFPCATTNEIEIRNAMYGNLICTSPTCLGRLMGIGG